MIFLIGMMICERGAQINKNSILKMLQNAKKMGYINKNK